MSTKVKGDKIKEGSIPLSALADDVKNVTGSYNVIAVFDAAGTYPFNFADYYFCKVGNKFVSLSGIENGQDIQIYDGPPIYIKYEHNGIYPTCVITDVAGYITKERPVEIVTINKSNRVFLPDDIGGADWNAQEGEAGYIENKPFYAKGDIRQIDVNGDYTINIYDINIGDKIDISWDLTYYDGEIFRGSTSFVIQKQSTTYYEKDNFYINGAGACFEMYAYGMSDSLYGKVIVTVNSEIKTLEDKYIPDTVIKTTPQTLSDDDKNQALANLGIEDLLPYYIEISNEQDWNGVTYDYDQLVALGINSKFLQGKYKNCFVDLNTNMDNRHIILPMSHYEYDDQGLLRAVFGRIMGEVDFEMLVSFEIAYNKDSNIYTLSSYIG